MRVVLAVDGGNSKTLAAVADEGGSLLSLVREGGSNFQSVGGKAAAGALERSVKRALERAGAAPVSAACYGVSGADRDKDFDTIENMIASFDPADKRVLVNDTLLALRAGTEDGVGVALVGGAGSNCIGMDKKGRIKKAWGLGPLTGDKANASALVFDSIVEAMKGVDGRGERTMLEDGFKRALGLSELEDIIEFGYFDSQKALDIEGLTPLVFEAAGQGDKVAIRVLRDHGRAAAEAALAVMRGLFDRGEEVPLVLGGSVLQKGRPHFLVDEIKMRVAEEFPGVELRVLSGHPILGGILRALDELEPGKGEPAREAIAKSLKDMLREGNWKGNQA